MLIIGNYTLRKRGKNQSEFFTVEITGSNNKGDYVTTKETYDKKLFDEEVSYEIQDLLLRGSGEGNLEYYQRGFYITLPKTYDDRTPTLISVDIVYTDVHGVEWNVVMEPGRYTEEDDEWEDQLLEDKEKVVSLLSNQHLSPEDKEKLETELKDLERQIAEAQALWQ